MCYRGGPRCEADVKASIALAEKELNDIEARRKELSKQEEDLRNGKLVITEAGGYRTAAGVLNERKRLFRTKKLVQERLDRAKGDWQLTAEGIQELRDKGHDVRAMKRQAERDALLGRHNLTKNASKQLEKVMLADGFKPSTIDYCNVIAGGSKNIRSAASYLKSREIAVANLRMAEQTKAEELASATTEAQKKSISAKYDGRIERALSRKFETEHDYFVTKEGLAELQAEADNPDLSYTEHIQAQIKHDRYAGIHKERKNDALLRRKRYDRITAVYKKAGKDPKPALKAHEVTPEQNRVYLPDNLRKNKTAEACVNPESHDRAEAIRLKSGFKGSANEYYRAKALESPVNNFRDVKLDVLNAGVKRAPEGHHRQRTDHDGDLRQERISIKWSRHDNEIIKARAKAFGTTKSSYLAKMWQEQDVRQHSNDRSVRVNEERTAKVTKIMQSGKIPA